MTYDESQVRQLADSIIKGVDAVKDDGIGVDDLDEAYGIMTALGAAADEAKDTDAFISHMISEFAKIGAARRGDPKDWVAFALETVSDITDKVGDRLVDPEPGAAVDEPTGGGQVTDTPTG